MDASNSLIPPEHMAQLLFAVQQQGVDKMNYVLEDEEKHTKTSHQITFRTDAHKIADAKGNTWLHIAAYSGSERMIQGFLDHGENLDLEVRNREGDTPLMVAVRMGRQKTIEMLLENGADVHAMNFEKRRNVFKISVETGIVEISSLLLSRGAFVNNPTQEQGCISPLHIAAGRGDAKMAQFLFGHGAFITKTPFAVGSVLDRVMAIDDVSPLFMAAMSKTASMELVDMLIEAGDDPQRILSDGSNVLHWAVVNNPTVCSSLLTKFQINPNQVNRSGWAPFHRARSAGLLSKFLESGAEADRPDERGVTLLMTCCDLFDDADAQKIMLLLNHSADPNQAYEGRKALTRIFEIISLKGARAQITLPLLKQIVKLFVEKGGKPDAAARKYYNECYAYQDPEIEKLLWRFDGDCILL